MASNNSNHYALKVSICTFKIAICVLLFFLRLFYNSVNAVASHKKLINHSRLFSSNSTDWSVSCSPRPRSHYCRTAFKILQNYLDSNQFAI